MVAPRAFVFDLDGTLVDSREDIAAACNHALKTTGRRTLTSEVIQRYVGDGARRLCARAAGLSDGEDELDAVVDAFMTYYLDHPADHAVWMPHALEVLDELRGTTLAVCTNKQRRVADRVLEALGVKDRFAAIVGGGDVKGIKPDPEGLFKIAATLDLDVHALVMIGDGPQDVMAGRNAGCRTIAVACGYGTRAALMQSRPDIILDTMREVPEIVRRWKESTVRSRLSLRP